MSYKIGEVAKVLEVAPVTIRKWEQEGLIPRARRTLTGQRVYSEEDICAMKKWLEERNAKKESTWKS